MARQRGGFGEVLLRRRDAHCDAHGGRNAEVPVGRPPGQHERAGQRGRERAADAGLRALGRTALQRRGDGVPVYRAVPAASPGIGLLQRPLVRPMLARWAQPDSLVPLASQGVQAWDRYAFVNNNSIRYNDPGGHYACGRDSGMEGGCTNENDPFTRQELEDAIEYNYDRSYAVASKVILG